MELKTNLIFWTVISFSLLVIVLYRFGFGPLTKILEERERRIRESLEQAEHTRLEAERLLREYEARLAEARAEAQKMIGEGRKIGESMKEDILARAGQEAERLLANARAQIERDTEQAIAELRAEVADLSVTLASKIIERSVDRTEHEQLVERFLAEIEELK